MLNVKCMGFNFISKMLHNSRYIWWAVHVPFTYNTTLAQKILTTTILCCTKLTSSFLSSGEHKQTIAIVNPAMFHIQSSTMEITQFSYWQHHKTNYYEPQVTFSWKWLLNQIATWHWTGCVRFEVLQAVLFRILIFQPVMLCCCMSGP